MNRQLTEKQELFLDYLFGEAEGDPKLAGKLAGYANYFQTVRSLRDEIIEKAEHVLALHGPKAAFKLAAGLDSGTYISKEQLDCAKQILDRIGVSRKENLTLDAGNSTGIFILPAKAPRNED